MDARLTGTWERGVPLPGWSVVPVAGVVPGAGGSAGDGGRRRAAIGLAGQSA